MEQNAQRLMCTLRQLALADGKLHLLMRDYRGLEWNSLAGRLAGK